MTLRIANRDARRSVNRRQEFQGSNLWAQYQGHLGVEELLYVVYSYGTHFPLLVFDAGSRQWFNNVDRYSNTTARHRSNCGIPPGSQGKDTVWLQSLIEAGSVLEAVSRRMGIRNAPVPWKEAA